MHITERFINNELSTCAADAFLLLNVYKRYATLDYVVSLRSCCDEFKKNGMLQNRNMICILQEEKGSYKEHYLDT